MMRHMIVTGVSKGLGEAVVNHLIESEESIHLTTIGRSENHRLKEKAEKEGMPLQFYECDLSIVDRIEPLMEEIFTGMDISDITGLYLLNNAGVVEPVAPLSRCKSSEILNNLHINLAAPMVLTSAFIRLSENMTIEKRVATITSGASMRAEYGWSAYCSAKAGVNLFTGCAAAEEQEKKHGVKLIAFSPGIMDTDMQQRIRNVSREDFKEVNKFIKYKEEGELTPPAIVAEKLLQILFADDIRNGEFISFRDLIGRQ
jgi:benzil reductase ((S)-benzoin forming)